MSLGFHECGLIAVIIYKLYKDYVTHWGEKLGSNNSFGDICIENSQGFPSVDLVLQRKQVIHTGRKQSPHCTLRTNLIRKGQLS